jgi:hypothetical protein
LVSSEQPWLTSPFQRLVRKHAKQLVAATVALAGAGTGIYYVSSVDSTAVGALILDPRDESTFTTDVDGCANGFTTDVTVQTNAPEGTYAVLSANGLRVAESTVVGRRVVFPGVMLGTQDKHVLVVKILEARAVSAVNVACGVQCRMLGPTWSPDTPGLNGAPHAIDAGVNTPDPTWTKWGGGDRVSSPGSPYQYRINGQSSIGVGSTIEVHVDGNLVGQSVRPTGGDWFSIHGVPVGSDDGDHSVHLRCVDGANVGFSTQALVNVDTKPPQLTTLSPTETKARVEGGAVRVCASTTSPDALDLSKDLKDAQLNLCAAVGTSTPVCAAATSGGASAFWTAEGANPPAPTSLCGGEITCTCPDDPLQTCTDSTQTPNGACVELPCPGPGLFDVRVSIYDKVRNATTKTIQAVRCQGLTGPSVQIVDPIGGSPLEISSDIAKRVLAFTTLHAPRRDQNEATEGAQYTVVACTDAAEGQSAKLMTGRLGHAVAQTATAVVTASAASCPHNEARFIGATLPESYEDSLGRLSAPTRLRVDIAASSSPPVDLWVDTTLPELSLTGPVNCGGTLPEAGTYEVQVRSNALPVTITVTNSAGTQKYIGVAHEPQL